MSIGTNTARTNTARTNTATEEQPRFAAPATPMAVEHHPGLPGGALIWIFITVELLTFFGFFVAFAVGYVSDPATFGDSQAHLSPLSATVNTVVLLTGSWLVARAASPRTRPGHGWRWMIATSLAGVVFVVIKLGEYRHTLGAGIGLSTNAFWFYYLFLTFFHLLHVAAGVLFCGVIGWRMRPGATDAPEAEVIEATAMYWHLVDLIWVFLFPLLYLVEVS